MVSSSDLISRRFRVRVSVGPHLSSYNLTTMAKLFDNSEKKQKLIEKAINLSNEIERVYSSIKVNKSQGKDTELLELLAASMITYEGVLKQVIKQME